MNSGIVRVGAVAASLSLAVVLGARLISDVRADEPIGRDIPAAFAPFEYLVGQWNGSGDAQGHRAQSFRGWSESHTWAWIFTKGKPTGMSVAIEGGKVLADGKLTYDPAPEAVSARGDRAEAGRRPDRLRRARSTRRQAAGPRSGRPGEGRGPQRHDPAVDPAE